MRRSTRSRSLFRRAATVAATIMVLPGAADACMIRVAPPFEDVSYADIVVIGRVENYRIVRDQAWRDQMLSSPGLSAEERERYQDPERQILSDYARFDVQVDEVVVGQAAETLAVTWHNSTFGVPDQLPQGRYLIALRRPGAPDPPLRGPSGTVFPAPDPDALVLLQAPCSSPFLYQIGSDEARTILEILEAEEK